MGKPVVDNDKQLGGCTGKGWRPGQSGNPKGRKPSGRGGALEVLDELLSQAGNVEALRADLQKRFDAGPAKFFERFVMPLLPKESLVKLETANVNPIRILGPDDPVPGTADGADADAD